MAEVQAKSPARRLEDIRPLSPHLQIYRWTWTMAMSVLHRMTGIALYAGTVLIVGWLVALASGPAAYECARWLMTSFFGKLVLFAYTWALFHHMLGGVRHFIWDTGAGFERDARMTLAKFTLGGSIILTVAFWVIVTFVG
ncbi:succinate dehydrogenase, cytochrome b556 subunit [Camelimonas sp. ID_303_24]